MNSVAINISYRDSGATRLPLLPRCAVRRATRLELLVVACGRGCCGRGLLVPVTLPFTCCLWLPFCPLGFPFRFKLRLLLVSDHAIGNDDVITFVVALLTAR